MLDNKEIHFAFEREWFPSASFPIDLFCNIDPNRPPSNEEDILVVELLRYGGELRNIEEGFALVFKDKKELGFCIESVLNARKEKLTSAQISID